MLVPVFGTSQHPVPEHSSPRNCWYEIADLPQYFTCFLKHQCELSVLKNVKWFEPVLIGETGWCELQQLIVMGSDSIEFEVQKWNKRILTHSSLFVSHCTVFACGPNIARVAGTTYTVERACCDVYSGTDLRTVHISTYEDYTHNHSAHCTLHVKCNQHFTQYWKK
jgi:hypothetical protein